MPEPNEIQSITVVLTAACNLSCGYCFQNDKKQKQMDWETLRASLDLLLRSRRKKVTVRFFGGEPLLEMGLIRRAVAYMTENRGKKKVSYHITTNGTLLRRDTLDFIVGHRFGTQLSFDGVQAAQNVRGEGTYRVLDELLDELRTSHRRFFRKNLHVTLTVTPATIRYLADSVEYFLNKKVQAFTVSPVFTSSAGWRTEQMDELNEQFERIYDLCLENYRRTGTTMFSDFFEGPDSGGTREDQLMCGAPQGLAPTVDVDGDVHGCVVFTESYQELPSAFLRDRLDSVKMGHVQGPELESGFREYGQKVRDTRLFHGKEDKYSSYARCGDCRHLAACSVCPASIGHIPGNTDPNRVPDFSCAYNLVSLSYREMYQDAISPRKALLDSREIPADLRAFRAASV